MPPESVAAKLTTRRHGRRTNPPMQWTEPAGSLLQFESRRGAGSATDRHYVMRPRVPSTRVLVLGVILLGTAVAAWPASYAQHFALGYDAPKWSAWLAGVDGELSLNWRRSSAARPERTGWLTNADMPFMERMGTFVQRASLYKGNVQTLGFGYVSTSYDARPGGITSDQSVWIPLWLGPALLVIPVAVAFRRWRRRRHREATGSCLTCGYDLRGSGSQCPECGDAVDERAAAGVILHPCAALLSCAAGRVNHSYSPYGYRRRVARREW
jgi:hypothetical protein